MVTFPGTGFLKKHGVKKAGSSMAIKP